MTTMTCRWPHERDEGAGGPMTDEIMDG
jgi:hypothetical protein